MAVYVIGDVQGCYTALQRLLDKIAFSAQHDQIWFAGDLVNRGPESLQVLEFVMSLGDAAVTVLGNHDLHLIAIALGLREQTSRDNLDDVLLSPRRNELFDWIRTRPLLHHDPVSNFTMIHAGLPPQWNLSIAQQCAREVEDVLSGDDYQDFIVQMYGNEPARWTEETEGIERWRFIVNCFTRLRYCDDKGSLVLAEKGAIGSQPEGVLPWFDMPGRKSAEMKIVFGHWSTLASDDFAAYIKKGVYGIDTGCVWGGRLSALRIDVNGPIVYSVDCQAACEIL